LQLSLNDSAGGASTQYAYIGHWYTSGVGGAAVVVFCAASHHAFLAAAQLPLLVQS
jgi:hypothetical protein